MTDLSERSARPSTTGDPSMATACVLAQKGRGETGWARTEIPAGDEARNEANQNSKGLVSNSSGS